MSVACIIEYKTLGRSGLKIKALNPFSKNKKTDSKVGLSIYFYKRWYQWADLMGLTFGRHAIASSGL
ncbi:hypothetical protein KUC3_31920 [Alteromonas sp. KC3]|nr:hypothetical protein KUC3_31920 [Alteromonas sp. KC3]BCO24301.1 hypothetical protein KUC14_31700 [Alteromonas sp. KC14]